MPDNAAEERAVARSISLLSTLSSALEVAVAIRERREGRDPSDQQTADLVLPRLEEDAGEVEARLVAICTSLIAGGGDDTTGGVALVRHMNILLLLAGVARGLHLMHQRMMSLYPAVTEDLVEDARRLGGVSSEIVDRERDMFVATLPFVQEVEAFLVRFRTEVKHI